MGDEPRIEGLMSQNPALRSGGGRGIRGSITQTAPPALTAERSRRSPAALPSWCCAGTMAPTWSSPSPIPRARPRTPASSTCSPPPSAGAGARTSARSCPRAFSVMRSRDGELDFLLEDVGPGTNRLAELQRRRRAPASSARSATASRARATGRRPILVGGGVGIAPLAIWGDTLGASAAHPARLPRRRPRRGRRADPERAHRHRRRQQAATTASSPPCSPPSSAATRAPRSTPAARRRCSTRSSAIADEHDVPGQLAHGVRHGLRVRRLLRLRRPHPAGLRPPLRRRPRHRRRRAVIDFCGIPLAHRIVNGSGTFDAIAARRAFGDALLEHFPFAAFVSKTVTLAPRQGNPPPRLWELAGGMINSIGLPNKGLEGYLRRGPAAARRAARAADRQRHGLDARGRRAAGRRLRRARRGRRDRAQRLVPERQDRADHGRRPARARRAARRRPPNFGETVDRQAHAQLRFARRRRGRRRGPRRRRRIAHQHAPRDGHAPAAGRARLGSGAGLAGCPGRRSGRSR